MDHERSRKTSQGRDQSAKMTRPSKNRCELNSSLPSRREMTSTRGKIINSSRQHAAAPQAQDINSSLAFLGAVNRSYPAKKSKLKRFKECSLSPCSDEYKFVMEGLKEAKEVQEEPVKLAVAPMKKPKNRKTFNEILRGRTKHPSIKITSEFENDQLPYFHLRPRGNTLPGRVSESLDDKAKTNTDKLHEFDMPFNTNVKFAWQEINDVLNISSKKETTRHTSLCYPMQRRDFGTMHRREGEVKYFCENSSRKDGGNVSSAKEVWQRNGEIQLPKINDKGFIDDLRMKQKTDNKSNEKFSTADQSSMTDLSRGANWMALLPQRQRSYSNEHFTENKDTARIKQALTYSLSLPSDHCKISEKNFASLNVRSSDAEIEKLTDKALSISQRSHFSITRANLRRVGNATLVATRLSKLHFRENGMKNTAVNSTQEEKELDEIFEETKDCRYLRQSSTDMRY